MSRPFWACAGRALLVRIPLVAVAGAQVRLVEDPYRLGGHGRSFRDPGARGGRVDPGPAHRPLEPEQA